MDVKKISIGRNKNIYIKKSKKFELCAKIVIRRKQLIMSKQGLQKLNSELKEKLIKSNID